MPGVGKPQRKFVASLFCAMFVTRGKINFRNLSRYSERSEKTYSRQFAEPFDFVGFNRTVIDHTFGKTSERMVVLDPSFIKKAGKMTPGLGYFYNGCASRAEQGLALSRLAIVDLRYPTALTLSTRQRVPLAHKKADLDGATMMDQDMTHLTAVPPHLHEEEQILVVDGQFARATVFDAVEEVAMTGISKLRRDARMRYFYDGPKRPAGSGRQQVYDGSVDWTECSRFEEAGTDQGPTLYTKVLDHVKFKRALRVVVLVDPAKKAPENDVIVECTDLPLDAVTIVRYYHGRAQIELLFRDAKQYPGVQDCQAREKDRVDFHFHASLTTLNIATAEQLNAHNDVEPFIFSMASVKARYCNEHYLHMIFSIFEVNPEMIKNSMAYQKLRDYGAIAA